MEKCFYLESIKAKGNKSFWALSRDVESYKHPDALTFWHANAMAYECHRAKKRNLVYKKQKRELCDLWWDIYTTTGLKLNGLHLGQIYLDHKKGVES